LATRKGSFSFKKVNEKLGKKKPSNKARHKE